MSRIGLLPALALMLAGSLAAQQVNPAVTAHHGHGNRGLAHYGKWASAVLAATFIGLGAHEYASSDDAFRQLLDLCRADATQCALDRNRVYISPASEQLYQTSLRHERRARVRLLAGQASVLLAAGLFLADHGGHGGGPDNIPYRGLVLVEPRADGARVGVRVRVRLW
jgi:hypothetical protein